MTVTNLTTRNLATRANAVRIAERRCDATGYDQAVIATGDTHRPFTVQRHCHQANIIDTIIAAGDFVSTRGQSL